jgi:hypothetical protein
VRNVNLTTNLPIKEIQKVTINNTNYMMLVTINIKVFAKAKIIVQKRTKDVQKRLKIDKIQGFTVWH